jgi:phosphatidylglycerophosphate synthase
MNLPNAITLSRIPLMFVIVGLMYCHVAGRGDARVRAVHRGRGRRLATTAI